MSAQYPYERLLPGDIRIMHVRPGRMSDPIQCRLQVHNLQETPEADYWALSYARESTSCPETLLVNDCSFNITYNLSSALRHIRDRKKRVTIWADAVCINQTDYQERSHQIRQMSSIYRAAARVIIWLGDSNEATNAAMDYLRHDIRGGELSHNVNVMELFCRPWWTRIWVIQEAASARHDPTIRCGNREIPWSSLRFLQSKVPFSGWMHFVMQIRSQGASGANELLGMIHAVPQREMFFGVVDRLRNGQFLSWRDAFALGYIMKSTDPRDLTYALIGLFDNKGFLPLLPDYHKNSCTVSCEAAAASLRLPEGLDDLALTASFTGKSLPTWVPDMADGEPGIFLLAGIDRYAAAGKTDARLSWSNDYKVLHASGIICDAVDKVVYSQKKPEKAYLQAKDLAYKSGKCQNLEVSVTKDRFWRTLIANQGRSTYGEPSADLGCPADEWLGDRYMAWQEEVQVPKEEVGEGDSFEWRMEYIKPYFASMHAVNQSEKWSFFTTKSGRFGLGQQGVMPGDLVCILHGGLVTYILRKEQDHYILVGCAYVHGIMYGETSHDLSDTTRVQIFDIH